MRFQPDWSEGSVPFSEYPRPQLRRESYVSLNGLWEYAITEESTPPTVYDGEILVPYSPESRASGVQRQLPPDGYLHYRRKFTLPEGFVRDRVLLNVGACDQVCEVFCNGVSVGGHTGGYLPFSLELTAALRAGENELCFVVQDDAASPLYGRGKQSYRPGGIWYTAISGLWQSVWLESVPKVYLKSLRLLPDWESRTLTLTCEAEAETEVAVYDGGDLLLTGKTRGHTLTLDVSACRPWSVDSPELYRLILMTGEDRVESYFGLRSFSVLQRGAFRVFGLNGEPVFHNGLLDQGYWPEGIYTPPSNRAMFEELKTVKELGFNMLRKHLKVEPALWYYYCDLLGLLVWQDLPNGGGPYSWLRIHLCPFIDLHIDDTDYRKMGRQTEASRAWYLTEAKETIRTLYNCVSVCLWTPFNEAWGQFDAVKVWKTLQQEDDSRPFDHASGWQDKGGGDVYSRHIYFRKVRLKNDKKRVLALTEFGGYSYALPGHTLYQRQFGYRGFRAQSDYNRAFLALYREEIFPAVERAGLCAAVYTQLTDVEEEINGIFTCDRVLKLNAAALKGMNAALYGVAARTFWDGQDREEPER